MRPGGVPQAPTPADGPVAHGKDLPVNGGHTNREIVRVGLAEFGDVSCDLSVKDGRVLVMGKFDDFLNAEPV